MKPFATQQAAHLTYAEYNGVSMPACYSGEAEEYIAVRKNILMTDFSHYGMIKVSGEDAWRILNYLISSELSAIRDEQLLYTLFLDKEGEIISDCYVAYDNENYLIISEWINSEELCQLINNVLIEKQQNGEQYYIDAIQPLTPNWRMICLEGPYAWDLLAKLFGMDIIGLPFHELMYIADDVIIMRVGKHGEYCFHLLGEEDEINSIWQDISALSEDYNLKIGGIDYLKNIRLENPCWEPAVLNPFSRCPIELQMQWAINYDKEEFIGQQAIQQRSDKGVSQQIVGAEIINFSEDIFISLGDPIFYQDKKIGIVVHVGWSFSLNNIIARVLLLHEFAYVNIDEYVIKTENGNVSFMTVSIPFINNLSLAINPMEARFLNRELTEQ